MPKWGLTPEQRKAKPWGFPEEELQPAKTITDPVHGDIYVSRLELRFLDSPPLQRLRRVRQLGTTHLVYPGATHTRLSHSLGALRAAQDLLDAVVDQRHGARPTPDLFGEWESKYTKAEYDRKIGEATVLARLGALLHDMCHVPFGHTVEDDLKILDAHDENIRRFKTLWSQLDNGVDEVVPDDLKAALIPLILSKVKNESPPEAATRYPFVADIVGNTICADLIDYLQRDHKFTGLPAKLGHRFIDGFHVTRTDHPHEPQKMVIQIARDGRDRNDVVSELFKYLRYRYELSERALVHHAKLAADAMVGKLLEMWKDAVWNEIAAQELPGKVKPYERDVRQLRQRIIISHKKPKLPEEIEAKTRERLEEEFLRHGDDGLLEHILYNTDVAPKDDRRRKGIAALARGLLERKLFKPIGHCSERDIAQTIYEKHGSPQARRLLEEEAARFLDLEHRWHVVFWIPSPTMRLKAAEVLVDDGTKVSALKDRDRVGANRGREIYNAHEALWAISVYVHPVVQKDPELCQRILAWIAERLGGVRWREYREQPTISGLVAREVGRRKGLPYDEERRLVDAVANLSAHKGPDTFEGLVKIVEQSADVILGGRQRTLELRD